MISCKIIWLMLSMGQSLYGTHKIIDQMRHAMRRKAKQFTSIEAPGRNLDRHIYAWSNFDARCSSWGQRCLAAGGNLELKQKYGCQIVGPKADHDRIPGIDVALADGDSWDFGSLEMRVFDTPGHTKGHITLWFPEAEALFPGTAARHPHLWLLL